MFVLTTGLLFVLTTGLLFVLKTLLLALTLTFCAEQIENVKTINRLVTKYFILIMIIFFQIYNYFIKREIFNISINNFIQSKDQTDHLS